MTALHTPFPKVYRRPQAFPLLLCTCLILVFLSSVGWSTQARAENGAPAYNYCEQGVKKTVLFLVDASDVYSQKDKDTLLLGFTQLITAFSGGERLIVKDIGMYRDSALTLINECYPTCPLEKGFLEVCKKQVVSADRVNFSQRLLASLNRSVLSSNARELPGSSIVGSISQAVKQYGAPDTLVVFSDFVEYSGKSGGKDGPNFYNDDIKKMDKYLQSIQGQIPDLSNTLFIGFGLGDCLGGCKAGKELSAQQVQRVSSFWNNYLLASKVKKQTFQADFALPKE